MQSHTPGAYSAVRAEQEWLARGARSKDWLGEALEARRLFQGDHD